MNHYARLGTVAVRLVAIGFFVLTLLSAVIALGTGALGTMMGQGQQSAVFGMESMMRGGMRMWWTSMLANLVIAVVLYAVSRPLGMMVGSGLADSTGVHER
jgi:hypothetical protein